MPNFVDFDTITDVKDIKVQANGWLEPLYVEYGVGMHFDNVPSYFWRVKGTKHTFVIPITRFHYLSTGNYGKHFVEVLEGFRGEYLEWEKGGFDGVGWQTEYEKEYTGYINL